MYRESFSGLSRSVWLLSLIMFINRAGAMVLPFMTLFLTKSLGFSLSQAGWVMGAYGVGSILGAYIGGQLTDKFGFYHIQLYSLIGSSVFLILLVFLTDYYLILLTVFVFSTVTDTLRPANSVAIAAYSAPEKRTRSFSLMRFAINLGFSVGPAMGGLVAEYLGYRWIFMIDALTCLGAALLLFLYLPYDASQVPERKSQEEAKSLSAYKDTPYIVFILLTAVWATLFFQLFTSVPVFWKNDYHYSEGKIGLLLALNGLIIVLFEMPLIKKLEHITRYMRMIAIGSLLLVLSFLTLVIGSDALIWAIIFIVLMSFAETFAMPFMTNYAVSRPEPDRRGQYMALYAMAYGVAHIFAPISAMQLAEQLGFNSTYWIFMVASLLITLAFYSMRKKKG